MSLETGISIKEIKEKLGIPFVDECNAVTLSQAMKAFKEAPYEDNGDLTLQKQYAFKKWEELAREEFKFISNSNEAKKFYLEKCPLDSDPETIDSSLMTFVWKKWRFFLQEEIEAITSARQAKEFYYYLYDNKIKIISYYKDNNGHINELSYPEHFLYKLIVRKWNMLSIEEIHAVSNILEAARAYENSCPFYLYDRSERTDLLALKKLASFYEYKEVK